MERRVLWNRKFMDRMLFAYSLLLLLLRRRMKKKVVGIL
jgi:hypothetical protein